MQRIPLVREIMTSEPRVIAPSDRVGPVLSEMRLSSLRHFPVVGEHGRLLGVVSDRDLLASGEERLTVREVMSEDVKAVGPETPAHEAAYLLLRYKIGCVPVVSADGGLVGIVTETDFVRAAYALLGGKVPVDELELEEREADRV